MTHKLCVFYKLTTQVIVKQGTFVPKHNVCPCITEQPMFFNVWTPRYVNMYNVSQVVLVVLFWVTAHRGYLHPSLMSCPSGTGWPGKRNDSNDLCFSERPVLVWMASFWTNLGLVLDPVRCLLELTDLPDDMRNLSEETATVKLSAGFSVNYDQTHFRDLLSPYSMPQFWKC